MDLNGAKTYTTDKSGQMKAPTKCSLLKHALLKNWNNLNKKLFLIFSFFIFLKHFIFLKISYSILIYPSGIVNLPRQFYIAHVSNKKRS